MATVEAFQIDGMKLWFWSNDHEPPHFHAKRSGEWEVKVHFLVDPEAMVEITWWKKKPSRRVMKKLTALAEERRTALLEQWERIQG